jgi:uncharacterized repeat protein (TIGR01451 family)
MFGYVNENVGNVLIPTGPNNTVEPGPHNQGQPQTFRPGFVDAAFTVRGVSAQKNVSWRLTFGSQMRIATASARFANKCLTAPITPVADIAISKSAAPRNPIVGQTVTSTITARNVGTKVLGPFTITDALPRPQLVVVSVKPERGHCRTASTAGARHVSCAVPTLAPGDSFSVRIVALASAPGSASDHASVRGVRGDATPHNNVGAATVIVRRAPPPPNSGLGLGLG